jgi:hypothetical protein
MEARERIVPHCLRQHLDGMINHVQQPWHQHYVSRVAHVIHNRVRMAEHVQRQRHVYLAHTRVHVMMRTWEHIVKPKKVELSVIAVQQCSMLQH